tara:strand:+ start:20263 stop:20967 length:705 start_codon:yes stop_codon:yes gene_type:complete
MKILIPPSEGKAKIQKPQDILFKDTNFVFEKYVKQVVRLLNLIDNEDLRSIYGTSQEKSELFHRQNEDIFKSRCDYAIERYTGVVYEHLKWGTLSDSGKKYMEDHVLIFSGLFGMTTPLTLIPDYKLKMNVLSLQYHWGPVLTDALKDEDVIFDLLPQVYRKSYKPGKNVINVDFKVEKKGKKTAAGHFGKAVKGKFIRFLAENAITDTKDFSGFKYDGFEWVDNDHFVKVIND